MAAASALRRLSFFHSERLSYPLERLLSTGVFQNRRSRVQDLGFGDLGFNDDKPLLLQQQHSWASNNVWEFEYSLCKLAHVCSRCVSTAVPSLAFAEASLPGEEFEEAGKQLPDVEEEEESVLEYLKRQGIDTAFLNEVELPKSLAVVKERIEFLLKIGLTIKDMNDYPLMIGCSVNKNIIPVLKYLNSLKVTKKSIPILIRRYPQILHSSVVVDLQPVVRYLVGLGVEPKQVGSVLMRYPNVLGFRIEGTMSTSVAYLVMLGVNARQIGGMLTERPDILGMRVGNNIKPKVEYISSLGIPKPIVGKMIENRPFILGFGLEEHMKPAVETLLEVGVRKEAIPQVLVQFPDLLGLDVKGRINAKLPWLTAKVGVSKDSMAQILENLPQILCLNVPMGSARVDLLRKAGFSSKQVGEMVTKCPQLLTVNVNDMLKANLEFLTKVMKRSIMELLEFPSYLTYDLEHRIRPRYEQVLSRGKQFSLARMLNCSDTEFQQRLDAADSAEGILDNNAPEVPFAVAGRLQVNSEKEIDRDDEIVSDENYVVPAEMSQELNTQTPRRTVLRQYQTDESSTDNEFGSQRRIASRVRREERSHDY
jgi:mTERF domain-containing protein